VFLTIGAALVEFEAPPTTPKATIVASNADRKRLMGGLSIISYSL